MEYSDLPTGYNPDDYSDDYFQFTPPSPIKTTNTNSNVSSPIIRDLDFQHINPTPLPVIRQNAFNES
jgi:hypothetical protein